MIFIYHNKYPYSPTATLLSQLNLFAVAILIIAVLVSGIAMLADFSVSSLLTFIIILALTLFDIFIYNDKLIPKLAEKEMDSGLRKSPYIAQKYCEDHPNEFNRITAINPKFASRFKMDEHGNIVRKKR